MQRKFGVWVWGMVLVCASVARGADAEEGFVSLFDGKSMEGWKVNENTDSWKIEEGLLVCQGDRSHIFYVGKEAPFKNFHLKVDVMTKPGANSGIYFHTKYQAAGWPKYGYEAQVNNSQADPKRTGSLYGTVDVLEAPAKDDQWFTEEVLVEGKRVTIKVNGKTLVEYTEPEGKKAFSEDFERRLGEGTFALQAHDPGSKVYYKNIRVKKLP